MASFSTEAGLRHLPLADAHQNYTSFRYTKKRTSCSLLAQSGRSRVHCTCVGTGAGSYQAPAIARPWMTRSVRCWPRPIYTNLDLQMLLNVRSNTVINVRIRDKADIFWNRCRLSLNWPGPKTKKRCREDIMKAQRLIAVTLRS